MVEERVGSGREVVKQKREGNKLVGKVGER